MCFAAAAAGGLVGSWDWFVACSVGWFVGACECEWARGGWDGEAVCLVAAEAVCWEWGWEGLGCEGARPSSFSRTLRCRRCRPVVQRERTGQRLGWAVMADARSQGGEAHLR